MNNFFAHNILRISAFVLGVIFQMELSASPPSFTHRYEADALPQQAFPFWQEIKGDDDIEGTAILDNGKLSVEVPVGARHYYAMGVSGGTTTRGAGAYDGSTSEGTTLEFGVSVSCEQADQEIFGIHVGRDNGRSTITFAPAGIRVDGKFIPHDATKPDTYRIAFDDGLFMLFSTNAGELYSGKMRPSANYAHNAIFFGTLAAMDVLTPGSWRLDFIRWTNKEANFSFP